jgi:hypothetical protein
VVAVREYSPVKRIKNNGKESEMKLARDLRKKRAVTHR